VDGVWPRVHGRAGAAQPGRRHARTHDGQGRRAGTSASAADGAVRTGGHQRRAGL